MADIRYSFLQPPENPEDVPAYLQELVQELEQALTELEALKQDKTP